MTGRIDDIRAGNALVPEVIDGPFESVLTPEQTALFNDTIAFINRTISAKALEAALVIGDYILTNYFNDDPELAFSKESEKPISFSILCEHPALNVSRFKLANMVKVAAQERFFRSMDFTGSKLSYSHRLVLTRLPNDENKIDLARQCVAGNLTTRQFEYRVKKIAMALDSEDSGIPKPGPPEKAFNALLTSLDRITGQVASLNFASLIEFFEQLSPEIEELLQNKVMTLIDAMDAAGIKCEGLLRKFQSRKPEEKF
jgi:hypothetical protein